MSRTRIALLVVALLFSGCGLGAFLLSRVLTTDPFLPLFRDQCGVCHGENFEGTTLGPALVGTELVHGDSVDQISASIAGGFPGKGMPAWSEVLSEAQIRSLAILIAERRVDRHFTDFRHQSALEIPAGSVSSEEHAFRIETVVEGLHPLPYSIAPLPDGRILVTEKTQGLRVVSPEGQLSAPIQGMPEVHDDGFDLLDVELGLGWFLDVAPHPGFVENGWIYLHHTHRCSDCNSLSRKSPLPVSMNRLVRGRIEGDQWVDEEVVWQADLEAYTSTPDTGAGGRIAFDGAGHVFLSVGIKGLSNYHGIQDLSTPYGKIHRVYDDGRVPADNPFAGRSDALSSIWSFGHRSPQGLEFDRRSGQLWGTEMGPRGGDELNLLLPGRNYGWPLTSKGLDYDGTPVEYGNNLGIEFDLADIEQPIVDMTPAPAISSFVLYEGAAFPAWQRNFLLGSLKATELYRMVRDGDRVVHQETLLTGLARIRDIQAGPTGAVYLLLEHATGGRIVRLVPAD